MLCTSLSDTFSSCYALPSLLSQPPPGQNTRNLDSNTLSIEFPSPVWFVSSVSTFVLQIFARLSSDSADTFHMF